MSGMVRRAYTGMIRAPEKVAEAADLYGSLKAWKNDLKPFSREYLAVDAALGALSTLAVEIGGGPLGQRGCDRAGPR